MGSIVDSDSLRRFEKLTNFFETPQPVADRMAELVDDVGSEGRILEPSAGRGMLMRAVQRAIKYPIRPVEFCEIHEDFIDELEEQGGLQVGGDFLKLPAEPVYDAIIMNPPYRNRLAEKHIAHAWNCTKPGGKIVALVGETAANWIDEEFMGHVFEREEFKPGTFAETNIRTWLFLIFKPLYE